MPTNSSTRKTNAEALAGLRPAFDKAGSVTAGNASGINDGAAAVLVMTAKKASGPGTEAAGAHRRVWHQRPRSEPPWAWVRCPHRRRRLAKAQAGKRSDVDLFELNEAFAAQACAVNKALDIDPAKVNVNGGAIAIGHPIGASGAAFWSRCCTKCSAAMRRRAWLRCASAVAWGFPLHWSAEFR
jgi:acetyl-CoA C-acetyltransferase